MKLSKMTKAIHTLTEACSEPGYVHFSLSITGAKVQIRPEELEKLAPANKWKWKKRQSPTDRFTAHVCIESIRFWALIDKKAEEKYRGE